MASIINRIVLHKIYYHHDSALLGMPDLNKIVLVGNDLQAQLLLHGCKDLSSAKESFTWYKGTM